MHKKTYYPLKLSSEFRLNYPLMDTSIHKYKLIRLTHFFAPEKFNSAKCYITRLEVPEKIQDWCPSFINHRRLHKPLLDVQRLVVTLTMFIFHIGTDSPPEWMTCFAPYLTTIAKWNRFRYIGMSIMKYILGSYDTYLLKIKDVRRNISFSFSRFSLPPSLSLSLSITYSPNLQSASRNTNY